MSSDRAAIRKSVDTTMGNTENYERHGPSEPEGSPMNVDRGEDEDEDEDEGEEDEGEEDEEDEEEEDDDLYGLDHGSDLDYTDGSQSEDGSGSDKKGKKPMKKPKVRKGKKSKKKEEDTNFDPETNEEEEDTNFPADFLRWLHPAPPEIKTEPQSDDTESGVDYYPNVGDPGGDNDPGDGSSSENDDDGDGDDEEDALEAERYFPLEEDSGSEDSDSDADEDLDDDEIEIGTEEHTVFRNFKTQHYLDKMHLFDLNDDLEVANSVKDGVTDHEVKCMRLTQQDEDSFKKNLPDNAAALAQADSKESIARCVKKHHERYRNLIDNLVRFMLAIGKQTRLPRAMRGWFVFLMANATEPYRERLVRMLTHPSVQPLSVQYVLGQDNWHPEMFDQIPHIDLKNPGAPGDVVSSYIAIGHLSAQTHHVYCGSATNIRPTSEYIGEEDRMRGHRRILKLGADEIRQRRREVGAGGTQILFAHDMLSRSKEESRFYLASHRYPVDVRDPNSKKSAALALLAELLNMLLLNSADDQYRPRKSNYMEFITVSRQLVNGLRPKDFPEPIFHGTNVVLPLTQVPQAMWNLVEHTPSLVSTGRLIRDLKEVFHERRLLSLLPADCEPILKENDIQVTRTTINALRELYSNNILREHGLEYLTRYQANQLKKSILFVAIIREAEARGLVYEDDGIYTVQDNGLDWVNVAEIGQEIAPDGLKDLYTEEDCEKLYKSTRMVDFKEKVALAPNWDRLRLGVPKTFVKSRRQMRHPLPIKLRMVDICRHIMYSDMKDRAYIDHREEDMVKVRPNTQPTLTHLAKPVTQQLRKDVTLSTRVQVKDGAWHDPTLRDNVITELNRAFNQLRSGISHEEAASWKSLQKLKAGWADPPADESGLETPLEPFHASARGDFHTPSHETRENVELLKEHHVDPPRISKGDLRINERIVAQRDVRWEANRRAQDMFDPDHISEDPFELRDRDGQTVRRTLFSTALSKKRAGKKKAGPAQPPVASDSGTCSRCLIENVADDVRPASRLAFPV
ncbi:hypothetical protein FSARC_14671 [Fusarium sarcochroum]|uniref:Uncharacterized protein n=1 Tax=Fusarium sarcochroum TaxID=1208366 RepID=A0A8H4SRP3_9HYPO|nr:hypothetical protein FSARC_14671 [Fusarium sarcochroum]